jgi:sarcosine oxidase
MVRLHVTGKLRGVTSECRRAVTCLYTRTADANFLIDRLPSRRDTIVVSACSGHGFKHSAAIGEAVADMAVSGRTPVTLLPFAMGANGG